MQDPPNAVYLLGLVSDFLRNEVVPQLSGNLAFQVRVAANAADLAQREFAQSHAANAAELVRLGALLGTMGTLDEQNAELCTRIRERRIDLSTPNLVEHLRQTMLAKLSVDQPKYSAYARARDAWGDDDMTA